MFRGRREENMFPNYFIFPGLLLQQLRVEVSQRQGGTMGRRGLDELLQVVVKYSSVFHFQPAVGSVRAY